MTPEEALHAEAPSYLRGVPIEIRLWARSKVVGDCWEHQGYTTPSGGYGQIHWRGKQWRAHRVAYTLACGPIPDGLDVLHSCDNPPCVKPAHLRTGTDSDNIRDSWDRRRRDPSISATNLSRVVDQMRVATHCIRGHEWNHQNTAWRADGTRRCRACSVQNHRRWRRANRHGGPCTTCGQHTTNHHGRNGARYCSPQCKLARRPLQLGTFRRQVALP